MQPPSLLTAPSRPRAARSRQGRGSQVLVVRRAAVPGHLHRPADGTAVPRRRQPCARHSHFLGSVGDGNRFAGDAQPCPARAGAAGPRGVLFAPSWAIITITPAHAGYAGPTLPRAGGVGEGSNAYCLFLCRQLGSPPRATLSMEVTLRRQAGPWRKGASRRKTRSPARASAKLCARHGEADEPESQHAAGQTGPGGRGRGRQLVQAAGASRCPPRPAGTRPVLPLLARTAWGDRARGSGKRGQGPPSSVAHHVLMLAPLGATPAWRLHPTGPGVVNGLTLGSPSERWRTQLGQAGTPDLDPCKIALTPSKSLPTPPAHSGGAKDGQIPMI